MVLAKELGTLVHAVDAYEPFLNDLKRRAKDARTEHLVQTHCMDMKDIPGVFQHIDLLWSEGSAYNIGFSNALTTWAPAINPNGFAVVSELSWLREQVPDTVRELFLSGYPDMHPVHHNIVVVENAGYIMYSIRMRFPRRLQTTIKSSFASLGEPRERAAGEEPHVALGRFD